VSYKYHQKTHVFPQPNRFPRGGETHSAVERTNDMKSFIKKIPILRFIAKAIYFTFVAPLKSFPGSEDYWKQRYKSGGNSGAGSYHRLAEFKAQVLNGFVAEEKIRTVIEFGCGDGNQLKLLQYPSYLGFDVSPEAISQCESDFFDDKTKTFKLMDEYVNETAELTLSLDVIYHLIEDSVFHFYMERLFNSSSRFVIIFSSNTQKQSRFQAAHVKHRQFSKWVIENKPEWNLKKHIPNKYPYTGNDEEGSFADFYIYEKA
jgi:SAM-dependent methyltransferase